LIGRDLLPPAQDRIGQGRHFLKNKANSLDRQWSIFAGDSKQSILDESL
jgi:hypothetical protein